jgi:hypothetical protein
MWYCILLTGRQMQLGLWVGNNANGLHLGDFVVGYRKPPQS